MRMHPRAWSRSPWLFACCALLYLGLIGPWLISARDTLAVAAGLVLLTALAVWALALCGLLTERN